MGKKTPRIGGQSPDPQKAPSTEVDPNAFYHLKPAWRISRLEFCDPYGWHEIDRDTLNRIRERLGSLEAMTWQEIIGNKNHPIRTVQLCKAAQDRLTDLHLDDVDRMTSLRLTGKGRIWGFVNQGIMTLLWWDPDHEVYPMNITDN
jgi:hypothetical protein